MIKGYWKNKAYSVSYLPSRKNDDLYYHRTKDIVYFLDFKNRFSKIRRTSSSEPEFEFPISFKVTGDIPIWKRTRLIREEIKLLSSRGFNVSNKEIYSYDGFCKICNKDMEKDGWLCILCKEKIQQHIFQDGENYVKDFIKNAKTCMICGEKIQLDVYGAAARFVYGMVSNETTTKYIKDNEYINSILNTVLEEKLINKIAKVFPIKFPILIEHHICYHDELTINVCPSCHGKIHHSKDASFKQYKPIDKKSDLPPKTISVTCNGCNTKKRILKKNYQPGKPYYCYKCKSDNKDDELSVEEFLEQMARE